MLHIGTTGGTIDKKYGVGKGIYDVRIGDPVIGSILSKVKYQGGYHITELLQKDSLDITHEDRLVVAEFIKRKKGEFLITHGTDTMIETAKVVSETVDVRDKLVILLGSAHPYSMKNTDADFNVGTGIGALQVLKQVGNTGIFIAMNGEVFHFDQVEKGDDGIFREKDRN